VDSPDASLGKFEVKFLVARGALPEFILTGTVTTLLGPLLPVLVKRCAMSDADAGSLVAAQFAGHFVGALFANRSLRTSIFIGMP